MGQNKYVRILKDSGTINYDKALYPDKLGLIFKVVGGTEQTYIVETIDGTFHILKEDGLLMTEKEIFHTGTPKARKEEHYQLWPGIEALDVMAGTLSREEFIGFLKGNILKYQLRLGKKNGEPSEKDIQKINTYKQILKENFYE
jgi:hypothetical protein